MEDFAKMLRKSINGQKDKFLNKIPIHDKIKILEAVDCILAGDILLLDIVKIKGSDNQYRVRIGNYRIKFKNIRYITRLQKLANAMIIHIKN